MPAIILRRKQMFEKIISFGEIQVGFSTWDDEPAKDWTIFLWHSCDEWIIGDTAQAFAMSRDLQSAVNWCHNNPFKEHTIEEWKERAEREKENKND